MNQLMTKMKQKKRNDDEILSNSASSLSTDETSLNHTKNNNNNNNFGMSNIQQTSDYESFPDCMCQSSIIGTANARTTTALANINLDNRFSFQSFIRVNGEGSSLPNDQQR
ncbi:unnamed protein product [Rotaria sp. Silwood1]|nr:unnamed protein product [Rotaria sp. Silwood1]